MAAPPENPFSRVDNPQQSSRKLWIWIVAGVVALVFTGIVGGFVFSGLKAAAESSAEAVDSTEPGAPTEAAFAWPQNMATGGVVFSGTDIDVLRSPAPEGDTAPAPRTAAELGESALIRLYVDYRCPYCALFEHANQQTLENVIASGEAALELHPLTFLDRIDPADYYSSRAAGALTCVVSDQPDQAWSAHTALMDPAFQPNEDVAGHDNAGLVSALDEAVEGLSPEARSCIEEERFVSFSTTLNEWIFSNPIPGAADPELKVEGTPFVLVDGVPYGGDPRDASAFEAFLREQGIEVS